MHSMGLHSFNFLGASTLKSELTYARIAFMNIHVLFSRPFFFCRTQIHCRSATSPLLVTVVPLVWIQVITPCLFTTRARANDYANINVHSIY